MVENRGKATSAKAPYQECQEQASWAQYSYKELSGGGRNRGKDNVQHQHGDKTLAKINYGRQRKRNTYTKGHILFPVLQLRNKLG